MMLCGIYFSKAKMGPLTSMFDHVLSLCKLISVLQLMLSSFSMSVYLSS